MLIQEMENRQYLNRPNVEMEMLYGIRPDLLMDLKVRGTTVKYI